MNGETLEGTRITLVYVPPNGHEFLIRTHGRPPRWKRYEEEMEHNFNLLTEEVRKENMDLDKVSDLILQFTYFWYNFMPLSRGTAACGYIGLVAMFLAIGIKIKDLVPEKLLVDWEAILRPTPEDFIQQIKPWLYPSRENIDIEEFESLPDMNKTFPTIKSYIEALNLEE